MKCLAKDRNNNECRNHVLGDTRFCKYHDYMVNYTEEMLEKCVCCSGCNKMQYLGENEKTCGKCRERAKKNQKNTRENIIICKSDGCKFKKSDENEYCMKHQICLLVEKVALRNKRLCFNYIRGCREELELDHKYNRCEHCLIKDREKDKLRRGEAKVKCKLVSENTTEKNCTVCCKVCPIEMFHGVNDMATKTCRVCREDNKKQDANRDKEHRNTLARHRVYYNYQKWAKNRNILFAIDKNYFENLIKLPCNYCGILQESGYNGVDRLNSNGIYELSNCVSCCQMCNYLKGIDTVEIFMKRIEHILTYNNHIFGELFPELFSNHTHISYSIYQKASVRRSIEFQLTESIFNTITQMDCYICGKSTTDTHVNGIDRFDSNCGYLSDNCRACCHSCNFLKNDYKFDAFMQQLQLIYKYTNNKLERDV